MFPAVILQSRLNLVANVYSVLASWMEPASLRWVDWVGHIALEGDAPVLGFRVGHRYGREQRLRIRMQGLIEHLVSHRRFNDLPEIHDRHSVAQVFDHDQVMRDKQVCQA